jgi:hypothetical protein
MGILMLVKEADEEVSLPADFVQANTVAAGAVSYFYVQESSAGGEEGLLQPDVRYLYQKMSFRSRMMKLQPSH